MGRKKYSLILAVATAVVLAGCGSSGSGTENPTSAETGAVGGSSGGAAGATGAGASGAAEPISVTIGYNHNIADNLPLWIAYEGGGFKKQGLDVSLTMGAKQGMSALISGKVDFAIIGGSDTLAAAAQGADVKYILTESGVYTFQLWARPSAASADKLRGKRVGITSTSGSQYAGTVLSLKKLGLKPSDVQVIALHHMGNVNNALISGSVAAAASHPPATIKFKQSGAKLLVDLAKEKIPNANTGLAVKGSYSESHPDVVQKVVNALVKATKREKTDPAFAKKMLKQYMKIDDKKALDVTYNYYAKNVAEYPPLPTTKQFEHDQAALGEENSKIADFDLSKLVDPSFVKKAIAGS